MELFNLRGGPNSTAYIPSNKVIAVTSPYNTLNMTTTTKSCNDAANYLYITCTSIVLHWPSNLAVPPHYNSVTPQFEKLKYYLKKKTFKHSSVE